MVRRAAAVAILSLALSAVTWGASGAAPVAPPADDELGVYRGVVDTAGLAAVSALGVDRHEIAVTPAADGSGNLAIEVILSSSQASSLAAVGALLTRADEGTTTQSTTDAAALVFRPYSGAGGIQEELIALAAAYPRIAQHHVIGKTVQGKDIVAVRVTRNPEKVEEGKRPTTIYTAAQHAREWITPEMVRRLLHHVLEGYGEDRAITSLVNKSEMWFVPVLNPDGYDFTFLRPSTRLWRKNLRDNDGDGLLTFNDGVDLNRNLPTRWGYDNEGSSALLASETYRGPTPASEPETQAVIDLFARTTPEFFINYHSAAELLLYGVGWQVATPSPDDVIYEAMAGDDAHPAVPGYDPDIGAELYTTNGEFDSHMQETFGALGMTPEMSTCQTVSASDPTDAWEPRACPSVFNFPDDEALIQAEFAKNLPFALSVARSAADPDDPVSVLGRDTPDFRIDSFDVSYGDPQTVSVVAKRALRDVKLQFRINGGRTRSVAAHEWGGGERYGFENDDYYAEYRAEVTGARPGQKVEVWFSAKQEKRNRRVESERFRYELESDSGNDVLVIANEDYTGVNPTYPPGVTAPKYLDEHVAALVANGITPDVWDVDKQGVPHDLGVLSHYRMVVWYLGDNRLTQDPEDELTRFGSREMPDIAVAERQQYLTMAIRDFLNEGGKLLHAGETTAYYGLLGGAVGGIYYGLDGAPERECAVLVDPFSDCLLLADDFSQYYLGAFARDAISAAGVVATAGPIAGQAAVFGGDTVVDNPIDEVGSFQVTSDVLPPDEFPQFASESVAEYVAPRGQFSPTEGNYAMVAAHADDGYMRLARTFDLTAVTAGDAPKFDAQLSFSTEAGYDHVIVEAHTVGGENWTTLKDLNGRTTTALPTECEVGFLLEEHPFLTHYLTFGPEGCLPTGSSGTWNSFTGDSESSLPVSFDLSPFAGQQVELVISYVTDPASGGLAVVVDDTRLTVGGVSTQAEGFETGLGAWSVPGAPAGSPGNTSDFERATGLWTAAAVATDDTIVLGFGLEQLQLPAARAAVIAAVLDDLLG